MEKKERRTEKGRRDNCARGTFELARSCDQISYGAAAQIKILEKKKIGGGRTENGRTKKIEQQ